MSLAVALQATVWTTKDCVA